MTLARTRRRAAVALLCACALAAPSACGGDEPRRVRGGAVTVYSSLPRHGVSGEVARAVEAGYRRALAEADGRAGGVRVRLRTLPSTEDGEEPWDPALVSANADRAAEDPATIAYLGELDYGASAVSLPVTNDAGILQVSPLDGLTSLTQPPPGRPRAGPERYYPSGIRNFARATPTDLDEAEALVRRAAARGARRIAVVFGQEVYGRELASQLIALARRDGLDPVASEEYRGRPDEIPDVVRALAAARPDAVLHGGVADTGTGRLLAAIGRELPGVPVYAASGLLAGPLGTTPADALPRMAAVRPAYPEERYGYEAMRLVLSAIGQGGRDRREVIAAALRARPRASQERLEFVSPTRFYPR